MLLVGFVAAIAAGLPAPVTLDGVGGVTPGMTPRQVAARWHVTLRLGPPIGAPGSTCRTAAVSAGGLHGYALFEHNRLGAVFFDRGARTPSGIGIGSSEAKLRRTYPGRLRREGHAYVHGGHYYFLTRRRSPRWRIRFDTNGRGRITQIGFGARAVSYVEGCA
jgi:hypothetical protein